MHSEQNLFYFFYKTNGTSLQWNEFETERVFTGTSLQWSEFEMERVYFCGTSLQWNKLTIIRSRRQFHDMIDNKYSI